MATLKEALRKALDEDDKMATAWLTEAESYTKLNEDVGNEVRKLAADDGWAYIVELFDDSVIYEKSGKNEGQRYFKALYTVAADGAITLGEAIEVQKVTTYPPAVNTEAAEPVKASFVERAGQLIPWEGE